jgi:hypothetical protein
LEDPERAATKMTPPSRITARPPPQAMMITIVGLPLGGGGAGVAAAGFVKGALKPSAVVWDAVSASAALWSALPLLPRN